MSEFVGQLIVDDVKQKKNEAKAKEQAKKSKMHLFKNLRAKLRRIKQMHDGYRQYSYEKFSAAEERRKELSEQYIRDSYDRRHSLPVYGVGGLMEDEYNSSPKYSPLSRSATGLSSARSRTFSPTVPQGELSERRQIELPPLSLDALSDRSTVNTVSRRGQSLSSLVGSPRLGYAIETVSPSEQRAYSVASGFPNVRTFPASPSSAPRPGKKGKQRKKHVVDTERLSRGTFASSVRTVMGRYHREMIANDVRDASRDASISARGTSRGNGSRTRRTGKSARRQPKPKRSSSCAPQRTTSRALRADDEIEAAVEVGSDAEEVPDTLVVDHTAVANAPATLPSLASGSRGVRMSSPAVAGSRGDTLASGAAAMTVNEDVKPVKPDRKKLQKCQKRLESLSENFRRHRKLKRSEGDFRQMLSELEAMYSPKQ